MQNHAFLSAVNDVTEADQVPKKFQKVEILYPLGQVLTISWMVPHKRAIRIEQHLFGEKRNSRCDPELKDTDAPAIPFLLK